MSRHNIKYKVTEQKAKLHKKSNKAEGIVT